MSQARVFSDQGALTDSGGTFASSLTVAVLIAAIGWFLVQTSIWQLPHLMVSVISFAILASIVHVLWTAKDGGRRFGEANQATLLRSGLVCMIASTLVVSDQGLALGWPVIGLIAVALMLDAVDGFLARRLNLCSTFGARFDMEVDAVLLLLLSILVWQSGQTGAWVLMIGLMRYAFVAASWFCPALAGPLHPSFRRKSICALQGIALMTCLLPPLGQTAASGLALAALAALSLSFGVDVRALLSTAGSSVDALGQEAGT